MILQYKAYTKKGVVNGYPDNTFKPENKITRLEFLILLNRLYRWDTQNPYGHAQSDQTFIYDGKVYSMGGQLYTTSNVTFTDSDLKITNK